MNSIETETAIIGTGQTGVLLARALAAAGRPVVLIEREHLGGSWVDFGCTPSEAIIASAHLAEDTRRAASNARAVRSGGKARELGRTEGFITVIVDADRDTILGATALCEQGSEIVQLFIELMNAGATTAIVRDAIHIHPSLAEAANNAVLAASASSPS